MERKHRTALALVAAMACAAGAQPRQDADLQQQEQQTRRLAEDEGREFAVQVSAEFVASLAAPVVHLVLAGNTLMR